MVCQLALYIKDSSHVIDTLKDYSWHDENMWALLDVASLYTSIPHEVGTTTVQYFLNKNKMVIWTQNNLDFCLPVLIYFYVIIILRF